MIMSFFHVFAGSTRPLQVEPPPNYVTFIVNAPNKINHQENGGGHVENCLPKGFHQSSGPSRYINYQPFGSKLRSSSQPPKNTP